MQYEEFKLEILNQVKQRFREDKAVNIQINSVIKNNGIELDSLVIFKENRKIAPNIYLNSFFEQYESGSEIDEIVIDLLDIYESYCDVSEQNAYEIEIHDFQYFCCWENQVFFRLINYDRNKKMLEEIPYFRFVDLAITFHCLIMKKDEGISSIRITNAILKMWKVQPSELLKCAMGNTPRLFPINFQSMNDILSDLLENDTDEFFDLSLNMPLYVLSNEENMNGAACMLYPDVIHQIAMDWESDIIILPCSIHEVILTPYKEDLEQEELQNMVYDINNSQVAKEDILSDKVYIYHMETKSFD